MFSKKNIFIQTTVNVVKHPDKNSDYWIVGRDSLFFSAIALAGVLSKDYRNYVEQSIEHLNPFEDYAAYTIVKNGFAMVWIWDNALQRNHAKPYVDTHIKIIPETVLKPNVFADGVYLVALYQGYETQYWSDGVLRASRWWYEMPNDIEWQRFCRAVSVAPNTLPEPIIQKIASKPWGKNFITKDDAHLKKILALLWQGSVVISLVLFAKLISAYIVQFDISSQLKNEMTQLELSSANILEQKTKVIEGLESLKRYSEVRVTYRQLDLMNIIGSQFPKRDNIKVVSWFYDQDRLVIEIIGKKLDPSFYVRIYQKMPQFKSVFSEPGIKQGSLRLRFELNMAQVQK